jgi:D-glycero-D-manno-heptose 1,7-bisphosphate phosphatase
MTMMRARHAPYWVLVGTFIACGGEQVTDLGSFGGGKADFIEIEFDLPCLDPRGGGVDTAEFTLEGSGPFKVSLTQPEVASGDRAYARIQIGDGERVETTSSSKSPSLEWAPDGAGVVTYGLTIFNRSSTLSLCAHLEIEELPVFAPPTARRSFAESLAFAPEVEFVPVAFFDADSTLRLSKRGSASPNGPEDVMLLPGAATGVGEAVSRGEVVVIVSNQGGVSYGYLTFEQAESALAETAGLLAGKGAAVHYFDFAAEYDENRKPETGMAERVEHKLEESYGVALDWDSSYMVGDAGWKRNVDIEPDGTPGEDFSNSDRGFAEALGIEFMHPRNYFGWIEQGVRNFHEPDEVEAFWIAHPDFPE